MSAAVDANETFALAASFVAHTSRHVFLTGRAGTGKTTFLKYIREHTAKRTVVVAPTGVAAINAGGVTAHSFFQLPIGSFIPGARKAFSAQGDLITDKHSLLRNIRFNSDKRKLLQELELLIIDEVSMMRADLLDAIDHILRHFRQKATIPFGGLQVLFIGDLYQLPPVVGNSEWEVLKEYYNSPFFFDAQALKEQPPLLVELKKIYRQSETTFINILNSIRNNTIEGEDLETLHERYQPDFRPAAGEKYILLTSHNRKADEVNSRALADLSTPLYPFEAEIKGDFSDKAFPAERVLQLKEGAQVMFIKNDRGEERRYYNGKIGTITKITGKEVTVKLDGNGELIQLEQEEWKNIRYSYSEAKAEIDEEELGTFRQFPIRLAWAITIHKSQGLTFEKAIVDAGDSFAPGQVYVALSRLTTLNGLVLRSRIDRRNISSDLRVVDYSNSELRGAELKSLLATAQHEFLSAGLLEAFSWHGLADALREHHSKHEGRAFPDKELAVKYSQDLFIHLSKQEETATRFRVQLTGLLATAPGNKYMQLHERITAAATYYLQILNADIQPALAAHLKAFEIKKRTQKYIRELEVLAAQLRHKEQQLQQAAVLTSGLANGRPLQELLQEIIRPKEKAAPELKHTETVAQKDKVKPGESKLISLRLFQEGKSLEEIAAARGYAVSTIESHLIPYIGTGELQLAQFVDRDKQRIITAAIEKAGNNELITIKAMLNDEISFSDVRAVLQHMMYVKAHG